MLLDFCTVRLVSWHHCLWLASAMTDTLTLSSQRYCILCLEVKSFPLTFRNGQNDGQNDGQNCQVIAVTLCLYLAARVNNTIIELFVMPILCDQAHHYNNIL